MRLLLDECLPHGLADDLRAEGHDCIHVYDAGLAGRPDREVMAAARKDQRIFVSADTDFGELLTASHADLPSVLIFRMSDLRVAALRRVLTLNLDAVTEPLTMGAVVIISDTKIRFRPLPI